MKNLILIFLNLVFVLLVSCDCQYEISGLVLDSKTKDPIVHVAIGKTDTANLDNPFNSKSYTSENGEFEKNGISGICDEVTMYFAHEDYFTQKITIQNGSFDTIYLKAKN